jgi:hypothetical protein
VIISWYYWPSNRWENATGQSTPLNALREMEEAIHKFHLISCLAVEKEE